MWVPELKLDLISKFIFVERLHPMWAPELKCEGSDLDAICHWLRPMWAHELKLTNKQSVVRKQLRKPTVVNKYKLKPLDIQKAVILQPERLTKPPFWRNNVVKAYCLSGGVGYNQYWIGFYDADAPTYAGRICLRCHTWDGMGSYKFTSFFKPDQIENEDDLRLQEMVLETINWLIDEGIVTIPKSKKPTKKGEEDGHA